MYLAPPEPSGPTQTAKRKTAHVGRPHLPKRACLSQLRKNGAEGQTRTVDTGIFSAVLYHLSYLGREQYLKAVAVGCQGGVIGVTVQS